MGADRPTLKTPTPEWLAGVLTLRYDNLALVFERFTETKDGVTSDLTAKIQPPGATTGTLLAFGRFRLHQAGDKAAIARRCAQMAYSKEGFERFPWDAAIEQACYLAVQAHRKGEPAIDIANVGSSPYPLWAQQPLVQYDRPTVVVAPGGTSKTWFACASALTMISGRSIIGIPKGRPRKVMFIDYESDKYQIADRMHALQVGHNIVQTLDGCFFYKHLTQPLANVAKEVRKEIADLGIEYVVVDSLVYAVGGMLRDEQSIIPAFMGIREWQYTNEDGVLLPVPTLIVSHVNKQDMRPENAGGPMLPFGSIFTTNAAGEVVGLKGLSDQDDDDADKYVAVTCEKINNRRPFKAHAYRMEFRSDPVDPDILLSVAYRPINIHSVPEFAEHLPMTVRVRELLGRKGKMTSEDVIDALVPPFDPAKPTEAEKKRATLVRSTLTNLKKREILGHNEQAGVWWLLDKHHQPN
jgi:hypothetical protein